jgi:hypothetical protein
MKRVGVKRAIMIALSVILALVVTAPMATAQSSEEPSLAELTALWWNWAVLNPSPLQGSYEGGEQCEGEFVEGVFFLAGTSGSTAERTCTVPADTPLLFPVFNVACSEAFTRPPDPTPYTECAEELVDEGLEDGGTLEAELDGQDLDIQRIASGSFEWTIPSNRNPFKLKAGTYDAASDGYWVYLEQGLPEGEYTLTFGGSFFKGAFEPKTTYHLIVE